MSELGPLDHISRHPLPWRSAHLTECGRDLSLITREQVKKRIADVGQKSAAYSTCMTCATTSDRYPQDLINAVYREAGAVQRHMSIYGPAQIALMDHRHRDAYVKDRDRRGLLAAELEAIQALVEAHREEFDGYLSGLNDTVKLDERRRPSNARRQYFGGAS